ncbi:MAG: hypothetical protein MK212_08380 [Saprospiraceae bacterium]|nr:hypothetical protein [Saprospiraceae bacterium]
MSKSKLIEGRGSSKVKIKQSKDQLWISIPWREKKDVQLILGFLFVLAIFAIVIYSSLDFSTTDYKLEMLVSPFPWIFVFVAIWLISIFYFILAKCINRAQLQINKETLTVRNKGIFFPINWTIPSSAIHQVYRTNKTLYIVDEQNRSRSLMGSVWQTSFPFPRMHEQDSKLVEDSIERFLNIKDQDVITKIEDIDIYKEALTPIPHVMQTEDNELGALVMKRTQDSIFFKLSLLLTGTYALLGWSIWLILYLGSSAKSSTGGATGVVTPELFLVIITGIFLYGLFKRNDTEVVKFQKDTVSLLTNSKVSHSYQKKDIKKVSIQTRVTDSDTPKEYRVLNIVDQYGKNTDVLKENQAYVEEDLQYIAVRIEQWRRGLR